MFSLAKKSKLNRYSAHRVALLRNLTFSLFKHGYVFTTKQRANAIKGLIDKLINQAKRSDLHNERQILSFFRQNKKGLQEVKKYLNNSSIVSRKSGYTSVKKVFYRKGDGALTTCIRIIIDKVE